MIHWDQALTELPASMTIDDTEYGTNRTCERIVSLTLTLPIHL